MSEEAKCRAFLEAYRNSNLFKAKQELLIELKKQSGQLLERFRADFIDFCRLLVERANAGEKKRISLEKGRALTKSEEAGVEETILKSLEGVLRKQMDEMLGFSEPKNWLAKSRSLDKVMAEYGLESGAAGELLKEQTTQEALNGLMEKYGLKRASVKKLLAPEYRWRMPSIDSVRRKTARQQINNDIDALWESYRVRDKDSE